MTTYYIITKRIDNDKNGNPCYELNLINEDGCLCNWKLDSIGITANNKGIRTVVTYCLEDIKDRLNETYIDKKFILVRL